MFLDQGANSLIERLVGPAQVIGPAKPREGGCSRRPDARLSEERLELGKIDIDVKQGVTELAVYRSITTVPDPPFVDAALHVVAP